MKEFSTSLKACEEALKLDTKNVKGYYLKARSRILDINSGVEELKLAVRDLKEGLKIDPENKPIVNQLQKIVKLVNINSKREKETYLNMFDKNNSVEEYVEKNIKKEVEKVQKQEERALASAKAPLSQNKQKKRFEKKVQKYMKMKENEFSFEVKKVRLKYPEIEEIKNNISNGEEAIELFMRSGKVSEAKQLKTSLQQARYEIEMLDCVMNLDFTKPRAKAKAMADEMGIDLTDEVVISEFKKMQEDRLKELRDVKDGKKKPGEAQAEKQAVEREDFNDIFRESNRAVIDGPESDENNKNEVEEEKSGQSEGGQRILNDLTKNRRADDQDDKNDEYEDDEGAYSSKTMIIGAVFMLWFTSLVYLFMNRS
jgi:hypothetical protein